MRRDIERFYCILSLVILWALLPIDTIAQTLTILTTEEQQPLPSARIRLTDISKGETTNYLSGKDGKIILNTNPGDSGKWAISISFIGYRTIYDTIKLASDITYKMEIDENVIEETVITAQYSPNTSEKAVQKIRILDSRRIQDMGAVTLLDVLSNELNIRTGQDPVLGSSMSIQGISGQNIKLLIDGVPVTGRVNGNIDISQINLYNVDRIEIIEGPLSVNYGTDALGGTINIITRKSQVEKFTFGGQSQYESSGNYLLFGKAGYSKGKHLLTLNGGRTYFDGWNVGENPFHIEVSRPADSMRVKAWKPKEQYQLTLFYGYYFKNLKFGYTTHGFQENITDRGKPRAPYFETAFDNYYKTYRYNNSINITGSLSKNNYLNALIAYNYFRRVKNSYFKDLTTLNEFLSGIQAEQDTSKFKNFISRSIISSTMASAIINYEIGYEINHETANGIRIINQVQQIGDYAGFGSAEIKPWSRLTLKPGLRLIYNTAYKAPAIPAIHIKYQIAVSKRKSIPIRFSYARGFRAPSLKELYFYFVDINHNIQGNTQLKAENSHNFNLSGSITEPFNLPKLSIEFSGYFNSIENMIALAQKNGTQFSYYNLYRFRSIGYQINSNYRFRFVKLELGFAYTGINNILSKSANDSDYLFNPECRVNLFYDWRKLNTRIAFFHKYTGRTQRVLEAENGDLFKASIQGYHLSDLTFSRNLLKSTLTIMLGIKNIFNVQNIQGINSGGVHTSAEATIPIAMGRIYFLKLDFILKSK